MGVEEKGVSIRLWGRVQGVGFRWWTRKCAQAIGVRGWVRNLPDGSVEIHAVGAGAEVKELEEVVRRGPPGAEVERISVRELDTGVGELPARGFEIRR